MLSYQYYMRCIYIYGNTFETIYFRLSYSHDKTYDLKYAMPAVNYTGNVKLEDIDGADGCLLTYVFTVPRTGGAMTAMEVYDNFYSTRIPGLQQLYGVGPGTPAKVSQEATCLEDTCSKQERFG
eukprot:TRINITY_DN380_c1_g1_i1.p3 TRINITY_DN380_c1_g1~~TRINITY_DN380_c1_g1_i1.p3  ORF type:complete len:124 (-),score=5.19 TRINITY_DN380_c1_g1_i1:89-460(-)